MKESFFFVRMGYAAEQGNERYPLELFLKVISVSLETIKIVKNLPSLEIHPLDRD